MLSFELIQTMESTILYKMRMRTEAKNDICSFSESPGSRSIVVRLIVCCPTGKCIRPTVGRSSGEWKALWLTKVIGECHNVIALVGHIYWPINTQKSSRPTVVLNVIEALGVVYAESKKKNNAGKLMA